MTLMSENINELMGALAKAQGKIQAASKDKANPFFKSRYADLASVWGACREPLSENGLAVIQTIQSKPEGMTLVTTLGHSSGQWMKSEMPIITAKNDPQSLGSAITYYRRYSLSAIAGVAPDDDDDGEKAQAPFRNGTVKSDNVKPLYNEKKEVKKVSKEQAEELDVIMTSCDPKYQSWVKESLSRDFNANTFYEIPENMFDRIKTATMKNRDDYMKRIEEEFYAEKAQ